jgi:hypothetical protein
MQTKAMDLPAAHPSAVHSTDDLRRGERWGGPDGHTDTVSFLKGSVRYVDLEDLEDW